MRERSGTVLGSCFEHPYGKANGRRYGHAVYLGVLLEIG